MKIFLNKKELIKIIKKEKKLGFVPTMGALHKGHISLIQKSNTHCNKTLVSIFINEQQFNSKTDYKKYPRTFKKDINLLKKNKVDYLYMPTSKEIYPSGYNKKIKISNFEKQLCGKFRPNHFKGVVDVVERFIDIIKPMRIYFGEKDLQQLLIIKDYFKKNKIKTRIIGCKTIRENNGIAYSSRNFFLSLAEKKTASKIYKILIKKKNNLINKKSTLDNIKKDIYKLNVRKIDYIKIFDINKIIKPYKKEKKIKIFIAYYLGKTRLIDNI